MVNLDSPIAVGIGSCLIIISILAITFLLAWIFKFSNRKWQFRTSDDRTKLLPYFDISKKMPVSWENIQQEDVFYEVNLMREKEIIAVHFDCGYTSYAPLESRVWFFDEQGGHIFPKGSKHPYIDLPIEGDSLRNTTMIELNKPIKGQRIMMQIRKPDILNGIPQLWRVNAVYVRVRTILGLKYTIGKTLTFLDNF